MQYIGETGRKAILQDLSPYGYLVQLDGQYAARLYENVDQAVSLCQRYVADEYDLPQPTPMKTAWFGE